MVRYSPLKDSKDIVSDPIYRRMSSDLSINKIITHCIEMGVYQQLQRELYRIRLNKGKRKISELTIYREAMKAVKSLKKSTKENGSKDSKPNPKPKPIYNHK
jgi:hypothetical protein